MTAQELSDEWSYRYHERVGLLIGTKQPVPLSVDYAATQEADAVIEELRRYDPHPKKP